MLERSKCSKGFTLVELLVVITIIAILSGAIFAVTNPYKLLAKSRDSKRLSDITELNKSIALALADGKIVITTTALPLSSCDLANDFSAGGATGWVRFTSFGAGLTSYMASLPRDPLNTTPKCYYYAANSVTNTWELNAVFESFENAGLAINDGGGNGTVATCTSVLMPSTNCRYEVGTNFGLIP